MIEREVEGEIILLDTESNLVHQLNGTASIIWRKWQEGASSDDIARMLAKYYSVEEHVAQSDVKRTIDQLTVLRIVK